MASRIMSAGDIGTFRGGSGFPVKYQGKKSGDLPFFKVSDMNSAGNELFMSRANNYISESRRKSLGAVRVPAGAIVFAKVGAAVFQERKRILAQDSCIDNNMSAFIVDENLIDVRFAHYLLTTFKMSDLVSVGALPSLNGGQLRSIPLLVPAELSEQRRIVDAIKSADALITTLERLIAKKQAIKQGVMQQLLTGRTRLPGYTDEWAWRPFPEVMIRMNSKKHQVPASSYSGVGHIPVVDQGQEPIIGYTDRVDIAFDPGAGGVVVFGDHTCITKFVDFRFAVGADGTQLVKGLPGNSTRFMAHALMANPIVSTGYNRHFKLLREKVLPVPQLAEQEAIASVLRDSETEVNALGVRLRKARAIKTGIMQKLLTGRTRLQVEAVS